MRDDRRSELGWTRRGQAALVAGLFGLVLASPASAQLEGVYFVAMEAPTGSISSAGASTTAVYLRWDVTEGPLPTDVEKWRILRDGVPLPATLPASLNLPDVLTASEIAALYAGPEQERRKKEIVRLLDGMDPVPGCSGFQDPVTESNFHLEIEARLLCDLLLGNYAFSILASRVDINIARARHAAFIDTGATPGIAHAYELQAWTAASGTPQWVRAGLAALTAPFGAGAYRVSAPAPSAFVQVETGRCDAPEGAKDHGVVNLNWNHAGAEAPERFANALLISGYDLYRADPATDSSLQVATLAAAGTHDAEGRVAIPGFTKVNEVPIVIQSEPPATESRYAVENPAFSQFQDAAAGLAAAGYGPGQQLKYFLVPRDFTGNYGQTVARLADVGDKRTPPAPWSIETVSKTGALPSDPDSFSLVWDHVDVPNYYADHQLGRRYCNLDASRFEGKLSWVPEEGSCDGDDRTEIALQVDEYLIYRFRSFEVVRRFADSDGDGYADFDEQVLVDVDGDPRPAVGTACDPAQGPVGATSYLVDTIPAGDPRIVRRPETGRLVVEWADQDPGAAGPVDNKDDVFWYAVAVRKGTEISPLSAPRRALFSDRTRPQLPNVVCGRCDNTYSTFAIPPDPIYPSVVDQSADGDAAAVVFSCSGASVTVDIVEDALNGHRGHQLSDEDCNYLASVCPEGTLEFLDVTGTQSLGDTQPYGLGFTGGCHLNQTHFLDAACEDLQPLSDERVMTLNPELRCECDDCSDEAVTIYQEIGGKSYKVATVLPNDWPINWSLPDMAGEQTCLSWSASSSNNVHTAKVFAGCIRRPLLQPEAPQPVAIFISPDDATGNLKWVPPRQRVLGTILEWYKVGSGQIFRELSPHSDLLGGDEILELPITATTAVASVEEWCFRARTVGRSLTGQGELSAWSAPLCTERQAVSEPLPQYLGWPKVPLPPDGSVQAAYMDDDKRIVLDLAPVSASGCFPSFPTCGDAQQCTHQLGFANECDDTCPVIKGALDGKLGFVAYRQDRAIGGEGGPFHQVSPLIDRVYCETVSLLQTMSDPFIKAVGAGNPFGSSNLVFVDRFPHVTGREYRYQLVYFDSRGEVLKHRTSAWVTVP